jgi:hypothetical protein
VTSKKRKDRQGFVSPSEEDSKAVTVDFGFDSMSIHTGTAHPSRSTSTTPEDTAGLGNVAPPSSYKLFSRSANAIDLWQEDSIVFLPAKGLLKQFSCGLHVDRVENAMKRAAKKNGTTQTKDKDKVSY